MERQEVIMINPKAALARRVLVLIPAEPKVMIHYLGLPPVDSQWEQMEQAVIALRAEGYIMLVPESDFERREKAVRADGVAIFTMIAAMVALVAIFKPMEIMDYGLRLTALLVSFLLAVLLGLLVRWLVGPDNPGLLRLK